MSAFWAIIEVLWVVAGIVWTYIYLSMREYRRKHPDERGLMLEASY